MWNRARQRASDFAADWGAPILLGLTTAAVVWTIWYITKAPCTAVATANGLCNPGIVARFINVEILLQFGGAALAAGALKGGYDRAMMRRMINEEREARQQAELELAEARKRNEENTTRLIALRSERKRSGKLTPTGKKRRVAEREEAYRQANADREETARMFAQILSEMREERREAAEERRQNIATQQALLDTIVRLAQQRNGNGHSENSDS